MKYLHIIYQVSSWLAIGLGLLVTFKILPLDFTSVIFFFTFIMFVSLILMRKQDHHDS
ncbi:MULTISPECIES: hypothetical protein [Breznakia]|uniref:Uncharacterized protein n=1 Tax=Breznakia blatticola TaxID=1754012 RepID=A0A4V3G8Y2_9FIRM|nr:MULTISPECIES: hypothetical protein [Breznakia]MDH6367193.1 hypothetical protein [Breznakia sp. PH1-1]MDH6404387.1 hypothetical protein [Breznakia sp. PF1-11]MDH6412096.1 hypothetical protein [Breznakia sp. PFB1-11]MDH6414375.1 hypothetical protein [Breznakia sp. PFB1-14]MDH6416695.1 hypothetical protein [Breznakia sp. PFB1-4]